MQTGRAREGCAVISRARSEPVFATALENVSAWLLVEHPGPWPWPEQPGDLPAETVRVLDAAEEAGVRVLLIRPVRDRRRDAATIIVAGGESLPGADGGRRAGRGGDPAGSDGMGRAWAERRTVTDLRELAALDVAALADGRAPGFGEPLDERVVLVCTHGRRDVCCARFGRPVAVLLDRALPGQVWETTHVGGDRFAANVVTVPDGHFHGGLTAADATGLGDAIKAGRIVPEHWRGRAGLPAPVQAAEYHLRVHLGLHSVDGITGWRPAVAEGDEAPGAGPAGAEPGVGALRAGLEDRVLRVELEVEGDRWYRVAVRERRATEERLTSCAGPGIHGTPTTYDLVGRPTPCPGVNQAGLVTLTREVR